MFAVSTTSLKRTDIATTQLARVAHITFNLFLILVLALFARRNLRLGRSDRKSAFRLAFFLFAMQMARWLLGAHHVPERSEADIVFGGLYRSFFTFALIWLFYIALEPYARRLWPRTMVSWVRLLHGRFRDPRVGRDILVGCSFSMWIPLGQMSKLVPGWLGLTLPRPDLPVQASELLALQSVSAALSQLFALVGNAMNTNLFIIVGFLLLRYLLRRTLAAVVVAVALMTLVWASGYYLGWLYISLWAVLWFFLSFRFGWLTAIVFIFVGDVLQSYPLTVELSAWYAYPTFVAAVAVGTLTLYAFKISLGGRPAFGDLLAEQ